MQISVLSGAFSWFGLPLLKTTLDCTVAIWARETKHQKQSSALSCFLQRWQRCLCRSPGFSAMWVRRLLCTLYNGKWIREIPARSLPVIGVDANTHLGSTTDGDYAPGALVGNYNSDVQNETGDLLLSVMQSFDLADAGSSSSWSLVQKRTRSETRNDEIDDDDDDYETMIETARQQWNSRYSVGEGPLPIIDPPERGVCWPRADSRAHSGAQSQANTNAQPSTNSSTNTDAHSSASSGAMGPGIRGTVQEALTAKRAKKLEDRRKAQEEKAQQPEPTDLASMLQQNHSELRSPLSADDCSGPTKCVTRCLF